MWLNAFTADRCYRAGERRKPVAQRQQRVTGLWTDFRMSDEELTTMTLLPAALLSFKAYAWDGFVERQARRLAEAAGALDFYVLVDETGGPAGPDHSSM